MDVKLDLKSEAIHFKFVSSAFLHSFSSIVHQIWISIASSVVILLSCHWDLLCVVLCYHHFDLPRGFSCLHLNFHIIYLKVSSCRCPNSQSKRISRFLNYFFLLSLLLSMQELLSPRFAPHCSTSQTGYKKWNCVNWLLSLEPIYCLVTRNHR